MEATIYVKRADGAPHMLCERRFTVEEWNRLRREWLESLAPDGPRGGAYVCERQQGQSWVPTEIFIRFEDLLAVI